jgi:hypothetical protein
MISKTPVTAHASRNDENDKYLAQILAIKEVGLRLSALL